MGQVPSPGLPPCHDLLLVVRRAPGEDRRPHRSIGPPTPATGRLLGAGPRHGRWREDLPDDRGVSRSQPGTHQGDHSGLSIAAPAPPQRPGAVHGRRMGGCSCSYGNTSCPRTTRRRAPVAPGRLPGRNDSVSWPRMAKATASLASLGMPKSSWVSNSAGASSWCSR